ncbi:MAG: hypothetical protein ACLP2P_08175 [Desulfobaccales bacterium]
MNRLFVRIIIAGMLVIGWSGSAAADWKSDIGYTALQAELGANMPTGAGVQVTQVEASLGMPDPTNAEFAGKTFTAGNLSLTVTSHATTVGQYFYGDTTSIAPGITNIECYDATYYTGTAFLNYGSFTPLISSSRVANNSWVGDVGTTIGDVNILARLDWVVNRDEYIQVVAMNNGGTNEPLLGSSFNAISVGLSNGTAAQGSVPLATTPSTPYALAGRTEPDLVAPASATSWATAMVSSATALLVQVGQQNPSLSTDPVSQYTTNRNGDIIYNADRSEVVKAALMAGADRTSPNLTNSVTPNGYTVNTANGLNNIYGAGQLNIYNSYNIIAAGEQNSREDLPSGGGEIKAVGFDYDPAFGGANGSNKTGSYVFTAQTAGSLAASLVWNLAVTGPTANGFSTSATLYNLGLYLYDTTSGLEVAYAASLVDNTENIYYTSLIAGDSYLLEVASLQSADFLWDYGLAWNITATTTHAPLPPTVYLLGTGIVALVLIRRKKQVRL